MTITERRNGEAPTVTLEGRLDTLSAPDLDAFLEKYYPSINKLTFDFANLDYISSSGLRVILKAQETMQDKGGIMIKNANKLVMGVFSVTGFDSVFRFE